MNIVIFGPPGSGKGTQADALCEKFDLVHVSTGDMLREAVRNETELGKQAQSIMNEGKLVPDELVGGIVREKVQAVLKTGKGILFDGYPRNVEQAKFLDSVLSDVNSQVDVVAVLEVQDEILVKRICGRRLCSNPECSGAFNVYSMPPKQEGICDLCGSELIQRKDDNEETLRERLEVYHSQTAPVLEYFGAKDLLIKVEAGGTVEDVRVVLLPAIEAKVKG